MVDRKPQLVARSYVALITPLLIVALAAGILFLALRGTAASMPAQDLAQYWAAAHLATQNPYSFPLVSQLDIAAGLHIGTGADPLVMRNPPWALVFVLPFRFMSYPTAFAFWAVLSFAAVAACGRSLWTLYASRPSLLPAFLSLFFGPTVCLFLLGQLAVLVLVGITIFLVSVERKRDWIAGGSLLFLMLKPHVTLLLLVAVILWAADVRRWKIIWGGALALAGSTIIAVALNHDVFGQYLRFAGVFARERVPYPNLSGIIYAASRSHALAMLPLFTGFVWLAIYWSQKRSDWDWKTNGLLVLLVSVVCTYYSYSYDEVIVLPALLAVAAQGDRRKFLVGFVITDAAYAVYMLNIAGLWGLKYMFLCWTGLAWLVTYLLSQRRAPAHVSAAA